MQYRDVTDAGAGPLARFPSGAEQQKKPDEKKAKRRSRRRRPPTSTTGWRIVSTIPHEAHKLVLCQQ
jgi:hypothetical protein